MKTMKKSIKNNKRFETMIEIIKFAFYGTFICIYNLTFIKTPVVLIIKSNTCVSLNAQKLLGVAYLNLNSVT